MRHSVVCPAGGDDRLDRVLARLWPATTRGAARRLIADGRVFVDGRRCRVASRPVHAGNVLHVASAEDVAVAASVAPPPILYEDADVLAIDKPAGMASAPTRVAAAGTARDLVTEAFRARTRGPARLWVVHRLDAGHVGSAGLREDAGSGGGALEAFAEGRVEKDYLARVAGAPAARRTAASTSRLATEGRRARVSSERPRGPHRLGGRRDRRARHASPAPSRTPDACISCACTCRRSGTRSSATGRTAVRPRRA